MPAGASSGSSHFAWPCVRLMQRVSRLRMAAEEAGRGFLRRPDTPPQAVSTQPCNTLSCELGCYQAAQGAGRRVLGQRHAVGRGPRRRRRRRRRQRLLRRQLLLAAGVPPLQYLRNPGSSGVTCARNAVYVTLAWPSGLLRHGLVPMPSRLPVRNRSRSWSQKCPRNCYKSPWTHIKVSESMAGPAFTANAETGVCCF